MFKLPNAINLNLLSNFQSEKDQKFREKKIQYIFSK